MPNTDCLVKRKPTKVLLSLSLILALVSNANTLKLKLSGKTSKKFRVYDPKKTDYTTSNTGVLDFENGRWLYFKSLARVEFHSNSSGFLDFSSTTSRFYKSVYLGKMTRVLVFPLAAREKVTHKLHPFVDKSALLTHPDQDYQQIFSTSSKKPLSQCFNESDFSADVGSRTTNTWSATGTSFRTWTPKSGEA